MRKLAALVIAGMMLAGPQNLTGQQKSSTPSQMQRLEQIIKKMDEGSAESRVYSQPSENLACSDVVSEGESGFWSAVQRIYSKKNEHNLAYYPENFECEDLTVVSAENYCDFTIDSVVAQSQERKYVFFIHNHPLQSTKDEYKVAVETLDFLKDTHWKTELEYDVATLNFYVNFNVIPSRQDVKTMIREHIALLKKNPELDIKSFIVTELDGSPKVIEFYPNQESSKKIKELVGRAVGIDNDNSKMLSYEELNENIANSARLDREEFDFMENASKIFGNLLHSYFDQTKNSPPSIYGLIDYLDSNNSPVRMAVYTPKTAECHECYKKDVWQR